MDLDALVRLGPNRSFPWAGRPVLKRPAGPARANPAVVSVQLQFSNGLGPSQAVSRLLKGPAGSRRRELESGLRLYCSGSIPSRQRFVCGLANESLVRSHVASPGPGPRTGVLTEGPAGRLLSL